MTWRTHSCVPCRDSSRHLPRKLFKLQASVETSLDAARTSARGTLGYGDDFVIGYFWNCEFDSGRDFFEWNRCIGTQGTDLGNCCWKMQPYVLWPDRIGLAEPTAQHVGGGVVQDM